MTARRNGFIALIAAVGLLAGVMPVSGADLRAEASVDRRTVGVGEMLTLTIAVYGANRISEPDLSVIKGFQVIGSSSSTNVSIVNMRMSRSLNLQYTLVALEEGEYLLGPFTVKAGTEAYDTEPIKVAVTKGQVSTQQPTARGQGQQQAGEDPVLLRASVDRRRAYVGQQVTHTLKLAYRSLDDTQYIPPEHTGFWFEDLGQSGPAIETIDGIRYYVITKRTAFFPISSGKFTIGEAGVQYVVGGFDPFSRDPFGVFGRRGLGSFGSQQGVAKTEPIDIEVLPLPQAGKPSDFGGAVGRFNLSVDASATEVRVGESLTLSVRIRGRGNLKSVGEIAIPDIEDFRVFSPKARESLNTEGGIVGGEKVFDLVLVPQRPGDYEFDGFRFSYFDPEGERYATSTAEPLLVTVLPGDAAGPGAGSADLRGRPVAQKDIRHIRRGIVSVNELTLGLGGPYGIMIRYLPVLLVFVGVAVSLQRRRSAITGRASARRAFKIFCKHLKAAERLLTAGGPAAETAAVVSKALKSYLAARYDMPESAVDEAFTSSMSELTMERRQELGSLMSDLDRIRFAPVTTNSAQVKQLVENARRLLMLISKEWKE